MDRNRVYNPNGARLEVKPD
uniref:Uncharacterized protein n=1 Tax=Rhizophora mucronata TaxID=61149 RepID=A0A2P2INR6_RHIMU